MRLTSKVVIIAGLAAIIVAGLGLQRALNRELQEEVELQREQHQTVGRLRAEQQRLRAAQITDKDLASLRSDHAAVERLRNEVERMRTQVQAMEREGNQ